MLRLRPSPKALRGLLGSLHALVALNAFGGGYYGLAGARGIPTEWLAQSPFKDYFVPSFVLLVVVGGSASIAAVAVFIEARCARTATLVAGAILLAWLAVQVALIGLVSWLQPTMAILALVMLGLGSRLPRPSHAPPLANTGTFLAYYAGTFWQPRRTFEALIQDPRRRQLGTFALLSHAALYTLVYLFLVMGEGRPTVFAPWLPIEAESYYRYDAFLLTPSVVLGWLLAAAVAQLLATLTFRGQGSFVDTASTLGFSIAAASWATLAHDLLTTCLGAFHVLNQRHYEDAMSTPTPFRTLIWTLMLVYLVAFLTLFSKAIGVSQRLRGGPALLVAVSAFAVYQGVFLVFNR